MRTRLTSRRAAVEVVAPPIAILLAMFVLALVIGSSLPQ